jgi:penicillin-binding protein 1A
LDFAMPRLARSIAILAFAAPLAAQAPAPQPTGEAWTIIPEPQSSLVFSREGSLLGEIGAEWRTSVPLSALPLYVSQAFIAVEDQRFYTHDGVDMVGIAGALKDAMIGHPRGASTITQQLVGNMHPDLVDRRDKTISRKLREQDAAREMEKHYTKAEILEAYLDLIHFGHGWYGVDAASRHYFGHPAAQLTIAEAATLAALPKGPAIYDPIRHADSARARRNVVLALMAQQGYLTTAQAHAAQQLPVVVAPDRGMPAAAPYVVDLVRRELDRTAIPYDGQISLRITTTVDAALQRDASDALAAGTKRIESREKWKHPTLAKHTAGHPDYLQGMIVALAPSTGDVLALVGGRDYGDSPFDRAVFALRQPGSSFKPVVYSAALAFGIQANTMVNDSALSIPLPQGPPYQPANADGKYLGAITLREALTKSRNTVAVQLGQQVGMDSVVALAARLGISTPVAPYPSSAIGASAVKPVEMVTAYTAFANGGPLATPRLILLVQDASGRTLLERAAAPLDSAALDPRVAFVMRDLMRDVVARGTATAVRDFVRAEIPVAGKTGTTNDNSDVWFIGMTPEIVAGVWLGFDTPASIAPGAAGGTLAAPIWGDMIGKYYRGRTSNDSAWDAPPPGVIPVLADRTTGAPADSTTPPDRAYTEYLIITLPAPIVTDSLKATSDSVRADSLPRDSLPPAPPPD